MEGRYGGMEEGRGIKRASDKERRGSCNELREGERIEGHQRKGQKERKGGLKRRESGKERCVKRKKVGVMEG